ncbi:MAG: helix-turn-helix transcriptional regulator [Rhodospirillales bacterium]|jgi:transcriptional regulator with XRE-family HTH domain|nr:helix-turn-helix transcriptional regulator [Rhodospirillales bacterium]
MSYKSEGLVGQIKDVRQAAGLSQRGLSDRSGLTQSHISQIERGTIEPGLSSLIDLARALDLELVLVPKKLLPAVKGVLQSTQPSRDLSPETGKAALKEIERGERLVIKQKKLYGGSASLDQIAENLRFLKHTPLRTRELAIVRDVIETLYRYQASNQSREIVNEIAAKLQTLRNRIAHGRVEEPRPAYAFDKDEDDA